MRPCYPVQVRSAWTSFILLNFWIDFVAAICYYPNEGISPQDVPCSDSGSESNCCGPGYACLSNKVCRQLHQDENGNFLGYTYSRGSCTDKKWRSSACGAFCIYYAQMANCDLGQTLENSYCCLSTNGTYTQDGVNGICDCSRTGGLTKPLHWEGNASAITTIGVIASTSSGSSSITTTLAKTLSSAQSLSSVSASTTSSFVAESIDHSVSANPSSSSSPSLSSSSHSSNRRAVAIGAGVGAPLALIVLGFVAFSLYRKLSHPSRETYHPHVSQSLITPSYHQTSAAQHELLANTGEHELGAALARHELPGAK